MFFISRRKKHVHASIHLRALDFYGGNKAEILCGNSTAHIIFLSILTGTTGALDSSNKAPCFVHNTNRTTSTFRMNNYWRSNGGFDIHSPGIWTRYLIVEGATFLRINPRVQKCRFFRVDHKPNASVKAHRPSSKGTVCFEHDPGSQSVKTEE